MIPAKRSTADRTVLPVLFIQDKDKAKGAADGGERNRNRKRLLWVLLTVALLISLVAWSSAVCGTDCRASHRFAPLLRAGAANGLDEQISASSSGSSSEVVDTAGDEIVQLPEKAIEQQTYAQPQEVTSLHVQPVGAQVDSQAQEQADMQEQPQMPAQADLQPITHQQDHPQQQVQLVVNAPLGEDGHLTGEPHLLNAALGHDSAGQPHWGPLCMIVGAD